MEKTDYLEVDNPIPGQNYTCISFISPDNVMKQKELFLFNKYMNQRCGELEKTVKEIIEKSPEDAKNKLQRDLVEALQLEMKYNYNQFKEKYDDFKYKFNDDLNAAFDRVSGKQTSIRGVKVRGCYDSYEQAEKRAKQLQRTDRSFHVFVGQVGYWLPWDPNADNIEDEEYLEDELNNLMKEYKKNEINRDIFYEEQKREKLKDAAMKLREHEKKQEELQDSLQESDPWMNSKFESSNATKEEAAAAANAAAAAEDGSAAAAEDGSAAAAEDGSAAAAAEDGSAAAAEDGSAAEAETKVKIV